MQLLSSDIIKNYKNHNIQLMSSPRQKISPAFDPLIDHIVNDPSNRQDILPFPYSMIDEVLNQTIIYKLNLQMHEIQQKKKDANYEGPVKQYVSQNLMDIEGISCLSQPQKQHNHLLAGDKMGNIYLLDLAKRTVFSKKQIAAGKKVIWIYDSIITDQDTSITTAAVINHSHHIISILRYRYSQPKLFLTEQIQIAPDSNDPNNLPYSCQLHDYCRLLSVKLFNGKFQFYRLPEVVLEIEKKTKAGSIPLEEEQIKKILKYPLDMANLELEPKKINEKVLEISFKGQKIMPKYSDIKNKLMNMKKSVPPPPEQVAKKDPKKKQQKKPQQTQPQKIQPTVHQNKKLSHTRIQQINGVDCTLNYEIPYYQPFLYFVEQQTPMPKSKYFQKAKNVSLLSSVIYGWKNTKQFYLAQFQKGSLDNIPEFIQIGYNQQVLNQAKSKSLKEYLGKKLQISGEQTFKNVYPITATAISMPDKSLLAFGLKDGTISVWNPISQNLQFNTQKHAHSVTCLTFFQKWRLISGDSTGQIFIHNVVSRQTQMKRTNTFQSKQPIPIVGLQVNDLGIAFCLDAHSNMRVFDLWRNQKISKIFPCSSYALVQGKGKRWLPCNSVKSCITLYSNRDFTVIISVNWPTFTPRKQDRTQQQIKKLAQITENPWRITGTNTHVIRNYDFLLNLFEGLESVYKKGYQRRKIQNLFSNLQFAQLNDRTFQIPDFSKPQGQSLKPTNSGLGKSLFAGGHRTSQKSLNSSKSKDKFSKHSQSIKEVKLTSQVLHPQKFLLERRKINKDVIVTTESLVDWIREQHSKKQVRETKLNSDPSKSIF